MNYHIREASVNVFAYDERCLGWGRAIVNEGLKSTLKMADLKIHHKISVSEIIDVVLRTNHSKYRNDRMYLSKSLW